MANGEINLPLDMPEDTPEINVTVEAGDTAQAPLDETLTVHGMAADAKAVGTRMGAAETNITALQASDAGKVAKPATTPDGVDGQLLRTHGDGTTEWVDQGLPTDEQTADAISAWLTAHPEATTTVQDGAVTFGKLHSSLQNEIGATEETVEADHTRLNAIDAALDGKIDGGFVENGSLYLTSNGVVVAGPFAGMGGGGSGGGDNNAVMTMTNGMQWTAATVNRGASLPVTVNWSSLLDEVPTGKGTLRITVNGAIKATLSVNQGNVTVDLAPHLATDDNTVRVTISDVYGNARSIVYTVECVEFSITSTFFDESKEASGAFAFRYTPVGRAEKTVHFKLDSTELQTVVTTVSNRELSYAIPAQTHGGHTLEVWFTATVNGETVESNRLYYEFYSVVSGTSTPIIISQFHESSVQQYDTIPITFQVYDPAGLETAVQIYEGSTLKSTVTADRSEHQYTYRGDTAGAATVKFKVGAVEKTLSFTVTALNIDAAAETEGLELHLNAIGRSNAEANPATWTSGNVSATLTGFNWNTDGWQRDGDGVDVLRVAGAARVAIPFQLFGEDFRTGGKTIEVEFATRNVLDYNTAVISCANGGRGLTITAQKAELKSELSEIGMQYREESKVRLSFVCEKKTEHRLLMVYINGKPSGVVQYNENDDFSQATPVGISIGSDYCTVDIYRIRVYDRNLNRQQVLDNFIADAPTGYEMLQRYNRNNLYDQYGNIVIAKLPQNLPYMVLKAVQLPQYKGDKKTIEVAYTDPVNPEKSFTATGCQANVQGTSSAPYARKNYDLQFKNGFELSGGHADNYALKDTVVPFNRFVLKADVASSEGANNVELVRLYCDYSPFKTREQVANSKVRQGIDGLPIVVFWEDTGGGDTQFWGKYNFNLPKRAPGPYGYSGDMQSWEFENNTADLMLFKTGVFDETPYTDPESGEVRPTWRQDFEARFPSDELLDYAMIQELVAFVASTDRTAATGDALETAVTYDGTEYTADTAAYRLAKFKAEFPTYAELDTFVYYYVFTELFLMVDSRAKNLFIGFTGSDVTAENRIATRKAVAEPYDMDTGLGTNNEGSLVFGYSLEDIDTLTGGASVFNGQGSVLWNNIRDAYHTEIVAMYKRMRSAGLSANEVERRFEEHQAKWPEAVWIEDSWFKYIDPLIAPDTGKEPTAVYLPMMQGSKEEQRKWWLFNRFQYMDSKWNSGDALSQVVQLRAYAKADAKITPYADIYVTVKYGSYIVQARGRAGQQSTITNPLDTVNDTETYFYSAGQIAEIGDLSGMQVGFADFSAAVNLKGTLKLGDADSQYENQRLDTLTLGSNRKLEKLDVRNCTALGTGNQKTVDISGCAGLKEAYFDGTAITGAQLPDGGVLQKLHLPNTITSLILMNQKAISELTAPTANLTTLRIENCPTVNTKALLNGCAANTRVRLVGIQWEAEDAAEITAILEKLDTMRGLDENGNNTEKAQISGTIHTSALSGAEIASFQAHGYTYLTFTADHTTTVLTYKDMEGANTLHTETIIDGGNGTWNGTPSHASSAQYDYTFAGWSLTQGGSANASALNGVTTDRTVYAAYTTTTRTYTATFVRGASDGGGTLYTQNNVPYGTTPTYGGATPTTTQGSATDYPFNGWTPALGPITGNTTYTAKFGTPVDVREITDSWADLIAAIDNGTFWSTYSVGNYLHFDLGAQGDLYSFVAAGNADELADGSGNNADVTFVNKFIANTSKRMNPSLETVYKYPDVPSWTASGNVWTSQNRYTVSSAKATWTLTVTADGDLTIKYKTSNGTLSNNKFSTITVNGTAIATDFANTTEQTETVAVTTGDTVTVYAQFEQLSASKNYYGTITFGGTATFTTSAAVQDAPTRQIDYYRNGTGSIGGWKESEMRNTTLPGTFMPLIQTNYPGLYSRIVEVKKYTASRGTDGNMVSNEMTADKLWLPSHREIFGSDSYETLGPVYTALFNNADMRKRYKPGASSPDYTWLRSASTDGASYFWYVYADGLAFHGNADNACGVWFGFSIHHQ